MTWLSVQWLWALPVVWGLTWLSYRYRQQDNGWQRWIDPVFLNLMQESTDGRDRLPAWHWLLAITLSLLIVALAGPSWQQREQPLLAPTSARVLVIDLSASMRAADIAPSRIEWARQHLLSIIADDFDGETALIVFSGQAYVVSPLTRDRNTLQRFVSALHPDQMPGDGNRLDQAIIEATNLLSTAPSARGQIMIISDGIEVWPAAREAAAAAYVANMELGLVAVGTAEGAPLPDGDGGLQRDEQGQIQLAITDVERLRSVAESGGGQFALNPSQPILSIGRTLTTASSETATATTDSIQIARENGGFWLLWLTLPCLILLFRRNALPVVMMAVLVGHPGESVHADWSGWWLNQNQQAWQALQADRPQEAVASATDPLLQGYARYKIADYRGVLELADLKDSADGLYLRGNAMVQLGLMKQAITEFEQALSLRADFSAARYNLSLVRFYLDQQANASDSDNQVAETGDDNAEILGQGNNQTALSAGSVENESGDGDQGGLGAGIVEELGRIPDSEVDAAVIDDELQQIIASLNQQSQLPQQEQLKRWAETLNADLGELFQRKFLRDYQRATGDR